MDNNPADAKVYGMGYDPDSELQAVTLTSGTSGFDGMTANQSVSYGYDAAGNRTAEQTPNFQHTFGTNNLNQLTNETDRPISIIGSTNRAASVTINGQAVAEDANNDYKTIIQPATGTSTPLTVTEVASDGTVNTFKNHIQNTVPYQYDKNGNMLNDGTKNYVWDAQNRLISVTYINPQPPTVADTVQMAYDGFGRRVSITEQHGTTILASKTFVWCGAQLCQERDMTGHAVTKQFFTLGEQINGSDYFYTFDHIGNVREMTDSNGISHCNYDYDIFGRQTKLSGDMNADFGYTDIYQEKATGLNLTWFRAYDANKGRWLNRDPVNERFGPNLYEYVMNNSLMWIDPFGLECTPTATPTTNPKTNSPGIWPWIQNNISLLLDALFSAFSRGAGRSVGNPIPTDAVTVIGTATGSIVTEVHQQATEVAGMTNDPDAPFSSTNPEVKRRNAQNQYAGGGGGNGKNTPQTGPPGPQCTVTQK